MWFWCGLNGFQIRHTSAEDDDVTSIRFSARKAKTAAARTGDSERRRGLNRKRGKKKGHKTHDSQYRRQSPVSRILEFGPRESAAGQWTDTQKRPAQSTEMQCAACKQEHKE